MAEKYVKKVSELLDIWADGPGTSNDDNFLIESAIDNLVYKTNMLQMKLDIARPASYSSTSVLKNPDTFLIYADSDQQMYSSSMELLKAELFPTATFMFSSDQNINDSTWTALTWESPIVYSGAVSDWWAVGNPTRIKFAKAEAGSKYLIVANVTFESDPAGFRGIRCKQSAVSPVISDGMTEKYHDASTANRTDFGYSVPIGAEGPTEYFELEVYQDSGNVVPVLGGITTLTIYRLK